MYGYVRVCSTFSHEMFLFSKGIESYDPPAEISEIIIQRHWNFNVSKWENTTVYMIHIVISKTTAQHTYWHCFLWNKNSSIVSMIHACYSITQHSANTHDTVIVMSGCAMLPLHASALMDFHVLSEQCVNNIKSWYVLQYAVISTFLLLFLSRAVWVYHSLWPVLSHSV
jgi:hypothetical protein